MQGNEKANFLTLNSHFPHNFLKPSRVINLWKLFTWVLTHGIICADIMEEQLLKNETFLGAQNPLNCLHK